MSAHRCSPRSSVQPFDPVFPIAIVRSAPVLHVAGIVRHVNRGELQLSPQRRQPCRRVTRRSGSRLENGSSRSSSRGEPTSAERARHAVLPAGELMWIAIGNAGSSRESCSISTIRVARSALARPAESATNSDLLLTVRCGHKFARSWKTETDSALVGGHDLRPGSRLSAVEPNLAAVRALQPSTRRSSRGFS